MYDGEMVKVPLIVSLSQALAMLVLLVVGVMVMLAPGGCYSMFMLAYLPLGLCSVSTKDTE